MTTWKSNLPQFSRELDAAVNSLTRGTAERALNSIVFGDPTTGAPGQPDDLRNGQWEVVENGPDSFTVGTNDPSAPAVEDGISRLNGHPIQLKSPIGGLHSVRITQQNAAPLVEAEVARVRGSHRV